MIKPALRWMLLLPTVCAIIVGFVAFAIAVDATERSDRMAEIDAELSRAILTPFDTVPAPGSDEDGAPPPAIRETNSEADPALSAELESMLPVHLGIDSEGTVIASRGASNPFDSSTLASLAALPDGSTLTVDGHRVRVQQEPSGLTRVAALSLDGYTAAVESLRHTLVLGGIVIVLIEAIIIWVLARRLTRPIANLAAEVGRIADGEINTSITQSQGGSREIVDLSTDVGHMVDRLRSALTARQQSTDDATRARDDMRRLFADVAHEIRTPLTALKGYSDLYARGMLDRPETLDRAMARVGDESLRLNDLVTAMLRLVSEGEPASTPLVQVDVAEVVANVVDDARVAFADRLIAVTLDEHHGSVVLMVASGQLHQAVLNLVANACQHTPSGTAIDVQLHASTTDISIAVVDHGVGIIDADREKIFLPFFRADPSRKRTAHDGAGLGLAVAQRIVIDHGGTLRVADTPGGGATFLITLPRDQARPAARA